MTKKKSPKRIKKKQISQAIAEKIVKAKSLTFADYRGLTVDQISQVRGKIKEAGGELEVTKNTLLQRALVSNQLLVTNNQLEGPTATVFAYSDEIAPIKALADIAKTLGLPKFKGGFLGNDYLTAEQLEQLAKLPSRDVLIGQVIGTLSTPIYGFANVLQENIRNLVYALEQIRNNRTNA